MDIALRGTMPYVINLPILLPITNTSRGVFYFWATPTIAAFVLCWLLVDEPSHADDPR